MHTQTAVITLLGAFSTAIAAAPSIRKTGPVFANLACNPSSAGLKSDMQYIQSDVQANFNEPQGIFAPGGTWLVQDVIGTQTLCVGIGGGGVGIDPDNGFATNSDVVTAIQQIIDCCNQHDGDTCQGGVIMTTSLGVHEYSVDIGPECAAFSG